MRPLIRSSVDGEIWNAKIIGQEKEYHYLENQSYNQNIAPGGEVSFGFIARCEDDLELSEYSVYGIKMWDQALEEDDEEEEEEAYFGETIWGAEDFERAEDYEAYLKSQNEYASYEYREDRPMLLNLEKGDTSFLESGEEETGTCGETAQWFMYNDGTMVIRGTGEIGTSERLVRGHFMSAVQVK